MESSVESWKGQERIDWNKTKQCERVRAPRRSGLEEGLGMISLLLFYTGKLESRAVCPDNGTVRPKPKLQSCWGEAMPLRILQCHHNQHRDSSDGVFLCLLGNRQLWRERAEKCYPVKLGSLIQGWQNDTNTPNENLHITFTFLVYLRMLFLTFSILSTCSLLVFLFPIILWIVTHPHFCKFFLTHPLFICMCTHVWMHTHTTYKINPSLLHINSMLYASFCSTITCVLLDFVKTNKQHPLYSPVEFRINWEIRHSCQTDGYKNINCSENIQKYKQMFNP